MKDTVRIVLVLIALGVLGGCNTMGRQPQLKNASIKPDVLSPGATAEISVGLKDRFDVVESIVGVVREDPEIKLKLRPEAKAAAQTTPSGRWSLQVDVPFQAPSGEFMLDITAYRADGTPVPVKNEQGKTVPLQETLPVVIQDTETK